MPYTHGPNIITGLRPTLYVNVPATVVRSVLAKHAGLATGRIPELVTAEDTRGAGSTSTGSEESEEDTDEEGEYEMPTSVVHLGAPPPLPPTWSPPQMAVAGSSAQ